MFENIGGKIKALATVVCVIGIIASVIGGIVMIAMDDDSIPIGIGTMIGGSLASWIGSFFTYGFGQLIEDTEYIKKQTLILKKLEILDDIDISVRKGYSANAHSSAVPETAEAKTDTPDDTANVDISIPRTPEKMSSIDMVCPTCHTRQSRRNFSCISCGQVFKF